MLETTRLKVKEICLVVGIGDASHFVRDFRKLYGRSPSEYRKGHLAKGRGPGKKDRASQ
jgi:AraC-like DNA-binding protein